MQQMICTTLNFVRPVSLDIWRIERYVCGLVSLPFHPQWSRSLQYMYASVCQSHAVGQCCMFLKSLLITFPLFPHCSLSSKILPVFSENCIFELVQVPYQSHVSTAKWHNTSLVCRQWIKNYYLRQYHLLLFTNIRNVCNTKHNLMFVWKLVKTVPEDDFCLCIIVILVIFENLCFTW